MSRSRLLLCALLSFLVLAAMPNHPMAYSINDPVQSCLKKQNGGPNPAGPFASGSTTLATECLDSYVRYTILDPGIATDVDLLYSGYFNALTYFGGDQPRYFLRALASPDSAGKNEFNIPWHDVQLGFNYFHAEDSTTYYGSTSFGGDNMVFYAGSNQDQEDRDHIDIYLNHPADSIKWDYFPAHRDNPDKKEDFPLSGNCGEYNFNAVQAAPVFRGRRVGWYGTLQSDTMATWFASGEPENVRIAHEAQHLFKYSRTGVPPGADRGFPNETFSMAAEYLSGAGPRDHYRPIYNSVYDHPLVLGVDLTDQDIGLAYSHWYLWTAYLLQRFPGDTTKAEDDLMYRWVRYKEGGFRNEHMYGLSQVLGLPDYTGIGGASGAVRLRNLFHDYSLAKWINNPSPAFYGGRYGFTRGVSPSVYPGMFETGFNESIPFFVEM